MARCFDYAEYRFDRITDRDEWIRRHLLELKLEPQQLSYYAAVPA